MHEFLYSVPSFIVAITILVAIHEFGHYWVAKILGVKILRFSIGFGKPLYKRNFSKDKTEFVIAAIPLGGYVKMLDEREGEVDAADIDRAFNRQHVAKRFAIVFAGPFFNFIFAVFAYWVMFVNGTPGITPVVGEVIKNSPAEIAGLQTGDKIVSINGVETPIWDVALNEFVPVVLAKMKAELLVETDSGLTSKVNFDFTNSKSDLEKDGLFTILGFKPWRPVAIPKIGGVLNDLPAAKAGLKKGDLVLKVNETSVSTWDEMAEVIYRYPDKEINLLVDSSGELKTLIVHTIKKVRDGKEIGLIGVKPDVTYPADMKINHQYSFFESFNQALIKTWRTTVRTFSFLGKMINGEVSLKNISGPITIAKVAGLAAEAGLSKFVGILALISVSLGILNLLPIPMLDGGHLFYYIIEIIKGSPVSASFEAFGQRIGIVMLLMLMSLAFYNDLLRLIS